MTKQKIKLYQISKTQVVTKLKNTKCDKTHKHKLWQQTNSSCGTTQKLKWWQILKTRIVTKLKKNYCDKTQKWKLWQNLKTQIVTKLRKEKKKLWQKLKFWQKSKTQIVTVAVVTVIIVTYFSFKKITPQQQMRCSEGSFLRFLQCFFLYLSCMYFLFVCNNRLKTTKYVFKMAKKCSQKCTQEERKTPYPHGRTPTPYPYPQNKILL